MNTPECCYPYTTCLFIQIYVHDAKGQILTIFRHLQPGKQVLLQYTIQIFHITAHHYKNTLYLLATFIYNIRHIVKTGKSSNESRTQTV